MTPFPGPGVPFDGLIQITDFKDESRMTVAEFPAIGSTLTAVALGFKAAGHQIWLGVKPSQIGGVEERKGDRNCFNALIDLKIGS